MAVQLRRSRGSTDLDPAALDLLEQLIDAPPTREARRAPAALRSVDAQRDHALRGFLRRSWLDHLLRRFEQLLVFTCVVILLWWAVDVPLRDWLHARGVLGKPPALAVSPASTAVPTAQPAAGSAGERVVAAPLPFTTVDMEAPLLADDFLAPGQYAPAAPVVVAPEPARLQIPAIELDTAVEEVFVVDGAWEVADYAAGYLHGTALPGEGNTALAGHAGLRGAVFRDLGRLAAGDDIYLDAGGWRYHYRVREATSVWPTQVEVLAPTESPVLTLITCTNWDTQRLVVVADLVGSQPSPGAH